LQQILQSYRFRWQIELIFRRFKQIAQLACLPKYDEDSARAWLYGKLFVALLTEKLIQRAGSISPGDIVGGSARRGYFGRTTGTTLALVVGAETSPGWQVGAPAT
jgi:hypothetical protein